MKDRDRQNDLPAGLAQPAQRSLAGAGIDSLEQLTHFSDAEIKRLHGVGPNAMEKLRRAMIERGLTFVDGRKGEKTMKQAIAQASQTASELITRQINELDDWRGELLGRLRALIHEAAPDIIEEWKWGTATWSQKGIVMDAMVLKNHVKLHFFKGALLADPHGLFNSGLDAKRARSIDFRQGDPIDPAALKDLIGAAVAYNAASRKKK